MLTFGHLWVLTASWLEGNLLAQGFLATLNTEIAAAPQRAETCCGTHFSATEVSLAGSGVT